MEDNTVDTTPVTTLEEPEIISVAETGLEPAKWMSIDGNCGGHGSEASSSWSFSNDEHVHNLRENLKRAFHYAMEDVNYENEFQPNPWFARVVTKIRDDPCFYNCNLEMDISHVSKVHRHNRRLKMTSLDVAILMGDFKVVQKILEAISLSGEKGVFTSFGDREDAYLINLFMPLHLAVIVGEINIFNVILEKSVDVNIRIGLLPTPIELACKMESVDTLQSLLKKDEENRKLIHIVLQYGDINLIKKVPSENFKDIGTWRRTTALHLLAAFPYHSYDVMTNIIKYLVQDVGLDVKALDYFKFSPFYVAVLCCNTPFVIVFLELYKDQIRLNEACDDDFGPPIQIAFEGGNAYKDIERALMECDLVKGYMDKLYRDRQVYVDAANAILVGAALIASVTFASWLQPPLNYTSYSGEGSSTSIPNPSTSDLNYADVEHNIPLRAFWVFNALSFYFAIATVVCGARAVLPRRHLFIEKVVKRLHTNLLVTSIFLACSVLFVIIAFAIAGTIVLTPLLKYQWCMIIPTVIGGLVCIISLSFLAKSMKEIYFNISETSDESNSRGKNYREIRRYGMHKSISSCGGLE